mmetsp:Transcript_21644/g.33305  ORF Transcript_21644/g.33305 Transcript_21644/m.33305 type:complete len:95 (-) Transcript_21644:1496-1780(-)
MSAENRKPLILGKAPHRIPMQLPLEASVKINLEPEQPPKEESSLIGFTLPPATVDKQEEIASPYKQQRVDQQSFISMPKDSPQKISVSGSKFKI